MRKQIFAEGRACNQSAWGLYKAIYEAHNFSREGRELATTAREAGDEACSEALDADYDLAPGEQDRIYDEGGWIGWPPDSPTRISISPLIDAGLELCD